MRAYAPSKQPFHIPCHNPIPSSPRYCTAIQLSLKSRLSLIPRHSIRPNYTLQSPYNAYNALSALE